MYISFANSSTIIITIIIITLDTRTYSARELYFGINKSPSHSSSARSRDNFLSPPGNIALPFITKRINTNRTVTRLLFSRNVIVLVFLEVNRDLFLRNCSLENHLRIHAVLDAPCKKKKKKKIRLGPYSNLGEKISGRIYVIRYAFQTGDYK